LITPRSDGASTCSTFRTIRNSIGSTARLPSSSGSPETMSRRNWARTTANHLHQKSAFQLPAQIRHSRPQQQFVHRRQLPKQRRLIRARSRFCFFWHAVIGAQQGIAPQLPTVRMAISMFPGPLFHARRRALPGVDARQNRF